MMLIGTVNDYRASETYFLAFTIISAITSADEVTKAMARWLPETARPNFTQCLCTMTVTVARSSFDDVAIRYVLIYVPVLWMTGCFHIMGPTARHVHF